MGEYADDYYRREVMNKHGFDPGSMYGDKPKKAKPKCPKCGKAFKGEQGVSDHLRDYHKTPNAGVTGVRLTRLLGMTKERKWKKTKH